MWEGAGGELKRILQIYIPPMWEETSSWGEVSSLTTYLEHKCLYVFEIYIFEIPRTMCALCR